MTDEPIVIAVMVVVVFHRNSSQEHEGRYVVDKKSELVNLK